MSILYSQWTSQPQQSVGIDWSNPITRGIVAAPLFSAGAADSAKSGRVWTRSSWLTAVGKYGVSLDGTGYVYIPEKIVSAYPFSFSVLVKLRANTAGQMLISIGEQGGATAARLYNNATTTFALQSRTISAGGGAAVIGGLTVGKWHFITGVITGDNKRVIMLDDAAPVSNTTSAALGFANFDTAAIKSDSLTLGSGTGDSSVAFATIWSREVTNAEHRALARNPWQIFKPLPRRIFVPVSAGGGTTAVTSDHSASYTITGSVAADSSASYTITGSVAADSSASYALRAAVAADSSASYALRAAVAADSSASYALRAAVAADSSASYALRAAVASDLASSYAIQTAGTVTTGLDAAYAVRSSVAGDISVGYQIAAAVQAEVAAAYAVRAAVQKDLAAGYSVSDSVINVASDIVCTYAINNGVSPSYPSAESIAAAILAAAQITPIHADMRKIKGQVVGGSGTEVDPWGPT